MPKIKVFNCILLFILFCLSLSVQAASPIKTTQKLIVLDPGHGGPQKGILISSALSEKQITLRLAQKAAKKLEQKYNVVLTRDKDTDLSQTQRISIANQTRADLFVAIHIGGTNSGGGFFYDLRAKQDSSRNKDESFLWNQRQSFYTQKSRLAAETFANIFKTAAKHISVMVSGAPLSALNGCDSPAILIEPVTASGLSGTPQQMDSTLDKTADLIAKSIDLYFKKIKTTR